MNYQKLYDRIVCRAKNRVLEGYSERHHVIPKCLGGTDARDNLVDLTAKEHFLCHLLLTKIHPNNPKILFAFNMMGVCSSQQQRRTTSRLFQSNRLRLREHLSKIHKGKHIPQYMRDAVREAALGRAPWNKGLPKEQQPRYGKKSPGVGGRKKGCNNDHSKGPRKPETVEKYKLARKRQFAPAFNFKGYEIFTPTGFQPFHGVSYSGLVPTLTFTLADRCAVTVSKKHRFITPTGPQLASSLKVHDLVLSINGYTSVLHIADSGKKQTYDVLEVSGGHLYYGNDIVHHNCEFVTDADSALFPEATDSLMDEIVYDIQRPPFFVPHVAGDLGYLDFTGVLFGYYHFPSAKVVIEDEVLINKATSAEIIATARAKEVDLWGDRQPRDRVMDGNAMAIADMNILHNYPCRAPDKSDLQANVNRVRMLLADRRLVIHPRCKNLISQIKFGTWDKNRTKFSRSASGGHWDLIAALVYYAKSIDTSTNPIPPGYGYDPFNTFGVPTKHANAQSEQLKHLFPVRIKV